MKHLQHKSEKINYLQVISIVVVKQLKLVLKQFEFWQVKEMPLKLYPAGSYWQGSGFSAVW